MLAIEYKNDIEESLREDERAHSFEWSDNIVRTFDEKGKFLEEYEVLEPPFPEALHYRSHHLYRNPVYRTTTSLDICTIEHCYSLSSDQIESHDNFIKKHESCPDCSPLAKFFYYERAAGFGNWYGLHIECRSCGKDEVIGGDEW